MNTKIVTKIVIFLTISAFLFFGWCFFLTLFVPAIRPTSPLQTTLQLLPHLTSEIYGVVINRDVNGARNNLLEVARVDSERRLGSKLHSSSETTRELSHKNHKKSRDASCKTFADVLPRTRMM